MSASFQEMNGVTNQKQFSFGNPAVEPTQPAVIVSNVPKDRSESLKVELSPLLLRGLNGNG